MIRAWMATAVLLALPFAMGAGCPYGSLHAVGPVERYEPTLTGLWEHQGEDGDRSLLELVRAPEGLIEARLLEKSEAEVFRGHVSVLEGARFMSLVPVRSEPRGPDEPLRYVLVRYEVGAEMLHLRIVEDALFKDHEAPASQEALRAFLAARLDDAALYGEPVVFRRLAASSADAVKRIARLEARLADVERKLDEALELLRGRAGGSGDETPAAPASDGAAPAAPAAAPAAPATPQAPSTPGDAPPAESAPEPAPAPPAPGATPG